MLQLQYSVILLINQDCPLTSVVQAEGCFGFVQRQNDLTVVPPISESLKLFTTHIFWGRFCQDETKPDQVSLVLYNQESQKMETI